ncbi:hypothetical protein [uncultured Tateyamaria sp.]|uniref:hypothetical protein n=1 Tax=uncultured Tateyamaria sp. TaxID=455651 RepID=UPI00263991B6|nr:hypothetical protein [uncultured Tateyamaria sp.]
MKRLILIVSLGLAPPAYAQGEEDSLSLMERGAQMLMEGLMREMEPALEDLQGLAEEFGPALRDFTAQMGPALRDLLDEVEDWSVYEPPEMLDNGDIIIRRKPPQEDPLPEPDSDGQIEL